MAIPASEYIIDRGAAVCAQAPLAVPAHAYSWSVRMVVAVHLFTYHLQQHIRLARPIVKIHVDDLLPRAQGTPTPDEWNG